MITINDDSTVMSFQNGIKRGEGMKGLNVIIEQKEDGRDGWFKGRRKGKFDKEMDNRD